MKYYDFGTWGVNFIFTLDGSVFQRSFTCSFPCALLAVTLNILVSNTDVLGFLPAFDDTTRTIMAGYTSILGFLIVFRSQQAYSRWWEAGTLLQQLRGQWFIAYSSSLAFCSDDPSKMSQVKVFQGQLVRLMSLLFALSLQRVTTMAELEFQVIDMHCLEQESIEHLRGSSNKVEIVLQWIQRLLVKNTRNGILDVAPPILSRVFQELSSGYVILQDVEKITEFQFPFPYCQLLSVLIILQGLLTPLFCAVSVTSPVWAGIATFTLMFGYTGVNYIAAEIEMPCGDDRNDLPLKEMQIDLNASLEGLLHVKVHAPPRISHSGEEAVSAKRFDRKSRLDTILSGVRLSVGELLAMDRMHSAPSALPQRGSNRKKVPRLSYVSAVVSENKEFVDHKEDWDLHGSDTPNGVAHGILETGGEEYSEQCNSASENHEVVEHIDADREIRSVASSERAKSSWISDSAYNLPEEEHLSVTCTDRAHRSHIRIDATITQ
eukprot:TRINITY_DN15537_c0_g1_i1.p1 TRINITY_DN15537_c0_g1~~TRINITY_DN15537_c0_g1_i1.p1  ORF type:complete len:491 (-),score=29.99 TRINITY_DN15537_c0_g1_i1:225-1697(-)